MKCKRCGRQMRREMVTDSSYRYVCPKCGLVIGGHTENVPTAEAEGEKEEG